MNSISRFLFVVFVLFSVHCKAQQPMGVETRPLTSSQVSQTAATKFNVANEGQRNVDQSGDYSFSVPLHTISGRQLSLPINANYKSGIKVYQKSSEIGLGWNISFGSISRDYGAFEPDYSTTRSEAKMENAVVTCNNAGKCLTYAGPGTLTREPEDQGKSLKYDGVNHVAPFSSLTPDLYRFNVPGLGGNSFWNQGNEGDEDPDFGWTEITPWKIEFEKKTFVIHQELSRINEINYFQFTQNKLGNHENKAGAIGILPYVENRHQDEINTSNAVLDSADELRIEYEDISAFTITTDNGTQYVFGRSLRAQKYMMSEDPYWSTLSSLSGGGPDFIPGEWWKVDYIAEWLLTEIRSADYVDKNGNGPDNADEGDWIKINYGTSWRREKVMGFDSIAVPKYREWLSFSNTDRYSSLWRELAYVSEIETPLEKVVINKERKPLEIDHDYFKSVLNNPDNSNNDTRYNYNNIVIGGNGNTSTFEINYPWEKQRYTSMEVYDKLNTDPTVTRNSKQKTIIFNYADQGSTQELAVSHYLIRSNGDEEIVQVDPDDIIVNDIEDYNALTNSSYSPHQKGRGKTTLLGMEFRIHEEFNANNYESREFDFEYGYNPSFSNIHKMEIKKMWSYPSIRQSTVPSTAFPRKVPTGAQFQDVSVRKFQHYLYLNGSGTYTANNDEWVDEMGNYHNSFQTNKGRHAWSLSKITYPSGLTEQVEYENDDFEIAEDRLEWKDIGGIIDNKIPAIAHYNQTAIIRQVTQDIVNNMGANNHSASGKKAPFRGFHNPMEQSSGGLRVKKITLDGQVDAAKVIRYDYGKGHYPHIPRDYLDNHFAAFSDFILKEQALQEQPSVYSPNFLTQIQDFSSIMFRNDFSFYMARLNVPVRVDVNVGNEHYYERVEETTENPNGLNSKVTYFYGDIQNPEELPYVKLNNFYLKGIDRDARPLVEGISCDAPEKKKPKLIKMEKSVEATSGGAYTVLERTNFTETLLTLEKNEVAFKEIELQSTDFPIYYHSTSPAACNGLYSPLITSFEDICLSSTTLSQILFTNTIYLLNPVNWFVPSPVAGTYTIYELDDFAEDIETVTVVNQYRFVSDPVYKIEEESFGRLESFRKSQSFVVFQEGSIQKAQTSTYNQYGQLVKNCNEGSTVTENGSNSTKYDCEYIKYGWEDPQLYISGYNWLFTKWRIGLPSEIRKSFENVSFTGVHQGSPLPTTGVYNSTAAKYKYETGLQTKVRTEGNFFLNNSIIASGAYSGVIPFSNSNPVHPWQDVSKGLEYDRHGNTVFNEQSELFTRGVPGYNASGIKASIQHPREWFDASYTGYEDHFYDWGDEQIGEEDEEEFWYDKNIQVRGSGADPNVVKLSEPTTTRKRTGRYSFQLLRRPSSSEPIQATPVRFIEVKPLPGGLNCDAYPTGQQIGYQASTSDCRFDYTASAWLTRGFIGQDVNDQSGGLTLAFVNPAQDPGPIDLYALIGDAGKSSQDKYDVLTQYYPLSDQVLLATLNPSNGLDANHKVALMNGQSKLSERVFEEVWNQRAKFKESEVFDMLVKPEQYPSDAVLANIIADYSPDLETLIEDILAASPYPLSGAISVDATSSGLEIPDGIQSTGLRWVYKVWNSDLTSVLYWGKQSIIGVTGEWKYYELSIPLQKHDDEVYLEVYIVDERSPYSSTAYTNGGTGLNAYSNYLKQTSTFIDDMIIYPKGGKYEYYSFDWKGNPINYTNPNDDYNRSTFDEFGRALEGYDFSNRLLSLSTYTQSSNLSQSLHREEMRTFIGGSAFSKTSTYMDGYYNPVQLWHQKSQQFGHFVIDSERDVYGRQTWVSKPFSVPSATLPASAINSASYLSNEWNFADPGSKSEFSDPFNQDEGEFFIPRLPIEAVISNKFEKVTNFSSSHNYTNTSGITKSFPQGEVYLTKSTDAEGIETGMIYNKFDKLVFEMPPATSDYSFTLDGDINWQSSTNFSGVTYYDYDNSNNLREIIDRRGLRTLYDYDARGNIIKETHPDKGRTDFKYDQQGRLRFTKTNEDQLGNLPSGVTERFKYYKYDEWNRAVEIGVIDFGSGNNHFNNTTNLNDANWPGSLNGKRVFVKYEYDASKETNSINQLSKTTSYSAHTSSGGVYTPGRTDVMEYEYDDNGNLSKTYYSYDEFSNPHIVEYEYNRSGLAKRKTYTHPDDEELNFEEQYTYNGDGQIATSKSRIGTGALKLDSKMTFDIYGHMMQKSLSEQSTNAFAENVFYTHNIREELTFQSGSKFYNKLTYDKKGQIINQKWLNDLYDNLSNSASEYHEYDYFYDELNRLVGANYLSSTAEEELNSGYGTKVESNPTGNPFSCGYLSSALGQHSQIQTESSGYLATMAESKADHGFSVTWAGEITSMFDDALAIVLDLDSRISSDPETVVTISHDELMMLTEVTEFLNTDLTKALNLVVPFEGIRLSGKNDRGKVTDYNSQLLVLNNTQMLSLEPGAFDVALFLKYKVSQVLEDETTSNEDKVALLSTVISDANSMNNVIETLRDHYLTFSEQELQCDLIEGLDGYAGNEPDPIPQSSEPDQRYDTEYYYDVSGNMNELNRVDDQSIHTNYKFNYDPASNYKTSSIKQVGGSGSSGGYFSYNHNGNIESADHLEINTMLYSPFNMPIQTQMNGGNDDEYHYANLSERIVKESAGEGQEFYLDGIVLNENETPIHMGLTDGFVGLNSSSGEYERFYTTTDWLGTVRATIKASGVFAAVRDHYPYGKVMPARMYTSDDEDRRFQFTGHEYDEETELGYHGARYYAREFGQYLAVDPLAAEDLDWNPYRYAYDNPISFIDPDGMKEKGHEEEKGSVKREGFGLLDRIKYSVFKPKFIKDANAKAKAMKGQGKDVTITLEKDVDKNGKKVKKARLNWEKKGTVDFTDKAGVEFAKSREVTYTQRKGDKELRWGMELAHSPKRGNLRIFGFGFGNYTKYNVIGGPRKYHEGAPPRRLVARRKKRAARINRRRGTSPGDKGYKRASTTNWIAFFYRQ